MKNYIGFLIKQKRLEQNLSQEGLCRGICVVSYLSKIEQGQVNPGQEIISQLFEALGIHYTIDEEQILRGRSLLREYFDKRMHEENTDEEAAQLRKSEEAFLASELNISYQLFTIWDQYEEEIELEHHLPEAYSESLKKLESFQRYMSADQLFLYSQLQAMDERYSFEEKMEWYDLAERQRACCDVLYLKGHLCFKEGKYLEAVQLFEDCYAEAAKEGRARVLLNSSFMLAICYSYHDHLENILRYYKRTMELARVINPNMVVSIYYNIGATYVEHEHYADAIEYLEKLPDLYRSMDETENINWLLVYHKLSFSYIQLGDSERGKYYLDEAKKWINADSNETIVKMIRLIEMRQEEHYQDNPEYERLLLEIYHTAAKELGHGFQRFHGRFLVALYKYKRRYKEALEVTDYINQDFV